MPQGNWCMMRKPLILLQILDYWLVLRLVNYSNNFETPHVTDMTDFGIEVNVWLVTGGM